MTGPSSRAATRAQGFEPPPYPYDRLDRLKALADRLAGGVVDCSVGTPCDPPPPSVVHALGASGTERGYPASAGGPAFRRAAADWIGRRFGVAVDPADLAACVGTKEMVVSTPHFLRLRSPEKDTVLYPAVSYPSYAMGAELAGCRSVPVRSRSGEPGGLDLDSVTPSDAERALVLWTNSPSNPTGDLTDLVAAADWGRRHDLPVFSDECYAEFTWAREPSSVLQGGSAGVVAVHSLSKRSNLAGVRAGFFTGDPELVSYLRSVRQHSGLMVPGPVQAAAAVALADDAHVGAQRQRYLERLDYLSRALSDWGCPAELPAGGFYLWVPVGERWKDGWDLAAALAEVGGVLVSPGELYGTTGSRHVRIAAVQPMERLRLVVDRLRAGRR